MRLVYSLFLLLSTLSATELIYVSNDASEQSLENLEKMYQQKLLINDNRVYLIPSDCRLERYFGGASNGLLQLTAQPEQTQDIVITQEVFEAKDEETITQKLEVEKSIALVEGKVSKAFLDDKEGRGFGGASEVPLDFTFQKMKATSVNMTPAKEHKVIVKNAKPYVHPSCELLADGSGYKFTNTKDARFYANKTVTPISKTVLPFN